MLCIWGRVSIACLKLYNLENVKNTSTIYDIYYLLLHSSSLLPYQSYGICLYCKVFILTSFFLHIIPIPIKFLNI